MLWIGEKFYKTPKDFIAEGVSLGFSRRISTIPHGFKIGETYVLLAHSKAVSEFKLSDTPGIFGEQEIRKPAIFYAWLPQRIEKICKESEHGTVEIKALEKRGIVPIFVPDSDCDHQGSVHDKLDDSN